MSIISDLSQRFGDAFVRIGFESDWGMVVPSQRPELAHYQCNGALGAAQRSGRDPRELAAEVIGAIDDDSLFASLDVAGPGFINITVTDPVLADHIQSMDDDEQLGIRPADPSLKVLVDYGGPNMSKSMHVGHLRASIIGESLKRLLRLVGHHVDGDIHLGDWGMPVGQLIIELESRHPELPYFDPDYTGPYPTESPVTLDGLSEMYPVAVERTKADPNEAERSRQATFDLQNGRPGYLALWQHFHDVSVEEQRRDFEDLGIEFDLWRGESTVHDRLAPLVDRLTNENIAIESDGAVIVEVADPSDKKEMPPLLLTRSDGSYLYSTTDLATLEQRAEDGYDLVLYVVDARQGLHFDQVFRAARRASVVADDMGLEHIAFGTVNGPDGKPFKTREGGILRLADLIEIVTDAAGRRLDEAEIAREYPAAERDEIATMVGLGALKFGDLSNHRTSNYLFDIDRFTSFEGKTGPYLQYGSVRMQSILRRTAELGLEPGPIVPPTVSAERDLMLRLLRLPEAIDRAVDVRAPNVLAEYAYEVATDFNRFYEACHILSEKDAARQASWLALVDLALRVLGVLLHTLGIEAPERM
ncbi:MAG: arginine--tRNA ligase [Acidobacteria bacterium]|nr:arginine--tRNA ligase [Acidobacteriota bacterium]